MTNITQIKILSSLEKIYNEDKIPDTEFSGFSMLKNEKKSFQLAIESTSDCELDLTIESSFNHIQIYSVEHIKSDFPMYPNGTDNYYRLSSSGYYPDLLLPADQRVHVRKGVTVIWFELSASLTEVGKHRINISAGGKTVGLDVEVIDAELDFKDFVYTCWFHTDCLMSYYQFDAFADAYWRVTRNFLKTAAEYGMTCVLTPLFTPPLDTAIGGERPTVQLVDVTITKGKYSFNFDKLTRWIEMATQCGIQYFEFSHFFTQWGAKNAPKIMATVDGEYKKIFGWETKAMSRAYKAFLKSFSTELKRYIKAHNLKNRVFIHVSDEPNFSMISSYAQASLYIRRLFRGYKIIDALSDYWFYRLRLVPNPIPSNDHIDKFIGKAKNLWVYYCCVQNNYNVSNRFFCYDSIRTRVIGYQMFKFDIKGFLQWGYNFYYKRLSKGLINPYEVTDAGGEFPSGDSFIVYPSKEGTALHSIRLKVFYDALQDMAALNTLEKLTGKNTCLDIIEEKGKHNITFREYPHSSAWLLATREAINSAIKENLS